MMGKHTNLIKYITLSSKGILAIVITRSQHKFIFTNYLLTSTSNPFVTKTGKTIPILLKLKIHLTTEKKNLLSNSVMRDHLDYSSLTGTIIFFYEIAFCMLLMNKLTKLQGDVRSFQENWRGADKNTTYASTNHTLQSSYNSLFFYSEWVYLNLENVNALLNNINPMTSLISNSWSCLH